MGKKVAFFGCSQKDVWYVFNFTVRRCLCVGNAGRSEVPNRNSICIPSVSKGKKKDLKYVVHTWQ